MKLRTIAALLALILVAAACTSGNPVGAQTPPPGTPSFEGGWMGSGH